MKKNLLPHFTIRKLLTFISAIFLLILTIICILACYFSYEQKKNSLLNDMENTLSVMVQEFHYITEDLWKIYMPIFETKDTTYTAVKDYFSDTAHENITPLEKINLMKALSQMMHRNTAVQWIALYAPDSKINYMYYEGSNSISAIPSDFPYLKELRNQKSTIQLYRTELLSNGDTTFQTFAISGGIPLGMGSGKILIGFRSSSFEQYYNQLKKDTYFADFYITCTNGLIYDSSNRYTHDIAPELMDTTSGINNSFSSKSYYAGTYQNHAKNFAILYRAPWLHIFLISHGNTLIIITGLCMFICIFALLYHFLNCYIVEKLMLIKDGLHILSMNRLDYRIKMDGTVDEFSEIADSINCMANSLDENIKRAYYHELKKKEAELSELQAKINPHFLYNSLEMLRSKAYENNDTETADMIVDLSAIFRSFIGSKNVVTLQEDLAFCEHYLSLFKGRYEDNVEILFDIDSSILSCEILRNLLQPIIENYFIHGFDTTEQDNYILLRGTPLKDKYLLLELEDNGIGITDVQLALLTEKLLEPIPTEQLIHSSPSSLEESYGLKNIHQRISLFYGSECGLSIIKNPVKGITVKMLLKRIT